MLNTSFSTIAAPGPWRVFIEQHHARVVGDGAANGAHLLLAARGVGRLAGARVFRRGK